MAYRGEPEPPPCPKCGKPMRPLHTGYWPCDAASKQFVLHWWKCEGKCKQTKATHEEDRR